MSTTARRPAVFLDRDGTVLDELGYLADPEGVRLLSGAAAAVARLNAAGIPVILITNQSGIARGYFDEETLAAVHASLSAALSAEGAHFEGVLYCPHHPEIGEPPWRANCNCRKPLPGLLLEAAERWSLDLAGSVVVGDTARDLEAGLRAGLSQRILVLTGKGQATREELRSAQEPALATLVVADLADAVERILDDWSPPSLEA